MLMFHSCAVVIATVIQNGDKVDCDASTVSLTILRMGIHCLRDDFVELSMGVEVIDLTMSMFFSHFSFHPNTWHSLPVTVCVRVFSVFGPTMRICLLRWQSKNLPAIYQPRSALL